MMKANNIILILLVLFFSWSIVSCDDDEATRDVADQLFRPALFMASVNTTEVTFSWVPIANATYSLEISRDSLLFETDLQVIPLEGVTTYLVKDLWSNSRYSARIKAVSKSSSIKNSEYNNITFKTGTKIE